MWIWIAMWKHPGGVISICPYQSLMSMHYQFAVARGIKRTRTSTQVQVHDFGRPSPDKVREKINKEIEESKHKWGSTLPSRTIHFPITARNTGVQWSPCVSPPAQNGSGHRQQYSFSFQSLSDKQRREAAADLPLKKLTQPLRKMKDNSFEPSGQFPISSRRRFDIARTHQACLWDQILQKREEKNRKRTLRMEGKRRSKRENVSAGGERSCGPGGARPSPIMAWHLESEPVKCQTGYDRNGDRQIMTDPWPRSSERSQLTQPPASWCAFRSRKKVSEPVGNRGGKFARRQRGRIHGNSLSRPIRSD